MIFVGTSRILVAQTNLCSCKSIRFVATPLMFVRNDPLPHLPGDNRGRTMNRGGSSQTTQSSIGLGRPSCIPRSSRSMSQPLPGVRRTAPLPVARPQLPSIPDEDPVNNITAADDSHSIMDKLDQVLARLDLVAASGSNNSQQVQVNLPPCGHPQSGNHTTGRRGRARARTTRSVSRAGRSTAPQVDVSDLDIGDSSDAADESEVEGGPIAHVPLTRFEEKTRRDMQVSKISGIQDIHSKLHRNMSPDNLRSYVVLSSQKPSLPYTILSLERGE